jgi:hypothetical protein
MEQGMAQISVSNLLSYQLGNLPEADPSNLSTVYDQLNFAYSYDQIRLNARVESFQTQTEGASYSRFTQKRIGFSANGLRFVLGNYYHIIGRGLLLRSYEIPGAIIEDLAYRTRYGFYRDMEGVKAAWTGKNVEINLLYGRPLNNVLPPTQSGSDFWRPHQLQAVESKMYLSDWQIGAAYLRDDMQDKMTEAGTFYISTFLPFDLQVYGEYSQKYGSEYSLFSLDDNTPHAFYTGISGQFDVLGISLEYKEYRQYQLDYNDPPPAVKEQQYLLLNRDTHSTVLIDETGWQGEVIYSLDGGHMVDIDFSKAVNRFFGNRYIFQEQFIEFSCSLSGDATIKGFADRNFEGLLAIEDRYTGGVYFEGALGDRLGTTVDLEYQTFNYSLGDKDRYFNLALLLSVSYAPNFTAGLVTELSDDPADTPEDKARNLWIGTNLSYQFGRAHFITLFYGKRRGGNACTSGICYEKLPFEGLELQINSTF